MNSLHKEVKEHLKEHIESLKEGTKLPSERILSENLKVSRVTVRHALDELKREGLIIKMHRAGNFVNIQENDSPVKLIIPQTFIKEHNLIASGVTDIFKEHNKPIQVLDCCFDQKKENMFLDNILYDDMVEGAIIYPFFNDPLDSLYVKKINDIIDKGKKVIIIDQYVPGINAEFVVSNKFNTAYRMTEHLIGLGHRDIVFISTGDYDTTGKVCKRGYKKALNDYNIPINENLIIEVGLELGSTSSITYDKLERLMQNNIFCSGVVSCNQTFTHGVLKLFMDKNINQIDLISTNSEDDFDIEIKKPYFKDDCYSLGKRAAQLYFEEKDKTNGEAERKIYFVDSIFVV